MKTDEQAASPPANDARSRLVRTGRIETIDGDELPLEADSICVHSDTPTALAIATALRARFVADGITVRAPGGFPG